MPDASAAVGLAVAPYSGAAAEWRSAEMAAEHPLLLLLFGPAGH
jgi:hypothetical protein